MAGLNRSWMFSVPGLVSRKRVRNKFANRLPVLLSKRPMFAKKYAFRFGRRDKPFMNVAGRGMRGVLLGPGAYRHASPPQPMAVSVRRQPVVVQQPVVQQPVFVQPAAVAPPAVVPVADPLLSYSPPLVYPPQQALSWGETRRQALAQAAQDYAAAKATGVPMSRYPMLDVQPTFPSNQGVMDPIGPSVEGRIPKTRGSLKAFEQAVVKAATTAGHVLGGVSEILRELRATHDQTRPESYYGRQVVAKRGLLYDPAVKGYLPAPGLTRAPIPIPTTVATSVPVEEARQHVDRNFTVPLVSRPADVAGPFGDNFSIYGAVRGSKRSLPVSVVPRESLRKRSAPYAI